MQFDTILHWQMCKIMCVFRLICAKLQNCTIAYKGIVERVPLYNNISITKKLVYITIYIAFINTICIFLMQNAQYCNLAVFDSVEADYFCTSFCKTAFYG